MRFNKWMSLQEGNLQNLYTTTVQAFPSTTRRQHATDPVKIVELNWTPFLGVNTLFIKASAYSEESGKNYNPMILFKNVDYHPLKTDMDWIEIVANDGKHYVFEKLNENNEVLIRCNCADFSWRWTYTDYLDHSLYGRNRRPYEAVFNPGSSNPLKLPGMCKHIIKMVKTLDETGILGH